MRHFLPYIIVVVATLLCVWILKPFESKVDLKKYEDKILALEQKVDSLHSENVLLETEADSLEQQLELNDVAISRLNRKIKVIKYETKQKLDAVDFFGDDELERFFADRYNKLNDTIN